MRAADLAPADLRDARLSPLGGGTAPTRRRAQRQWTQLWLPFGRRSAIAEVLLPDKPTPDDYDDDDDACSTDAPSVTTDDVSFPDGVASQSGDDELQRADVPFKPPPDPDLRGGAPGADAPHDEYGLVGRTGPRRTAPATPTTQRRTQASDVRHNDPAHRTPRAAMAPHSPFQANATAERSPDSGAPCPSAPGAASVPDDAILLSHLPSTLSRRARRRTPARRVGSPIGVNVAAAPAPSLRLPSPPARDDDATTRRDAHSQARRAQPDASADARPSADSPRDGVRRPLDDPERPTAQAAVPPHSPPRRPRDHPSATTDDLGQIRSALRDHLSKVFRRQPTDQRL